MLLALEPLLIAGFSSRRRSLVNISTMTWNTTFGKEESLRYPSRLEKVLQRLRRVAEISLPTLEPVDEAEVRYTLFLARLYLTKSLG